MRIMYLFILIVSVALASSNTVRQGLQNVTVKDKDLLTTTTSASTEVTSRKSPTTAVEETDEVCQCVAHHLCDSKDTEEAFQVHHELGYREERPCLHYSETCCAKHQILPKPRADPTKVKGCGYRNPKGFGRIFAEHETKFGEFPWVIALLDSTNSSYAGAGVLISPEVVMTVAHTAKKFSPGTLKIRAGEWDTQTVNEIYEHQEREVKEIYIHEDYQQKSLKNNIALLRLEQPLELTEHINAICLPEQDEIFDGYKKCISNGWGKDVFGRKGVYSVILHKIEQNIVPHDQCESLLKKTRLGARFQLHDSFVCASEDGMDTCKGDGGAALACPIEGNRYTLSGLLGWGIGCGREGIPAVYSNVPKFRKWVDDKMKEWGLQIVKNE